MDVQLAAVALGQGGELGLGRHAHASRRHGAENSSNQCESIYLCGVPAWTTELEFAYEHGHVYLLDGARHWSDDDARVDLRMPRRRGLLRAAAHRVLRRQAGARARRFAARGGVLARPALRARSGSRRAAAASSRSRSSPAPTGRAGAPARTTTGCSCGPARRRAAVRAQAPQRPRERPRRPARAARRRGRAGGRDDHRHARVGDALRLDLHLSAWAKRTWERTIRCDGVVRWLACGRAVRPRAAARRAPRAAAVRRRARRAVVPRPAGGSGAARARVARRPRGAAGRHIEFEDGLAERLRSATGGWRAARSRCCAPTRASPSAYGVAPR